VFLEEWQRDQLGEQISSAVLVDESVPSIAMVRKSEGRDNEPLFQEGELTTGRASSPDQGTPGQ
jgi:hypothetical protein